tara:strand:+ start:2959 stop:3060 length:102 start_codon:yes stop_codon:yes gene_type:complete
MIFISFNLAKNFILKNKTNEKQNIYKLYFKGSE